MTANGSYDPDPRTSDRGNSFIKLDKGLNVIGSWTPAPYDCLSRTDADLGSAGPDLPQRSVGPGRRRQGRPAVCLERGCAGQRQPAAWTGRTARSLRRFRIRSPSRRPTVRSQNTGAFRQRRRGKSTRSWICFEKIDDSVLNQGYHHIHGSPVQWTVHTAGGRSPAVVRVCRT